MAIWDLLKRRAAARPGRWLPVTDDREDRYDVLPATLHGWADEHIRRAADHHAMASGPYPRPGAPHSGIAALRIPMASAVAALSRRIERFDGVLPPSEVPSRGPAAFGPSLLTAVLLGRNGEGLVADVELILRGGPPDEEFALLRGLAAISPAAHLIVVDWQLGRIAQLDDDAELRAFLAPQP